MSTDVCFFHEPTEWFKVFHPHKVQLSSKTRTLEEVEDEEKLKDIKQYIQRRVRCNTELVKGDENRMLVYPPPTFKRPLRTHTEAVTVLRGFADGFYGKFIDEISKLPFNTFIGGSSCLAAADKDMTFKPDDIDMYIEMIDVNKMKQVHEAVRRLFPGRNILLVRRALTLAMWVLDDSDMITHQVQVNITRVPSWAHIHNEYHSDPVCVGFDIKRGEILYNKDRWDQYANNLGTQWFSNIYSNDNPNTLAYSAWKYHKRGVKTGAVVKEIIANKDGTYEVGDKFSLVDLTEALERIPKVSDNAGERLIQFGWYLNVALGTEIEHVIETKFNPMSIHNMALLRTSEQRRRQTAPKWVNIRTLAKARKIMESDLPDPEKINECHKIGAMLYRANSTGKLNLMGDVINQASGSLHAVCREKGIKIFSGKLIFPPREN